MIIAVYNKRFLKIPLNLIYVNEASPTKLVSLLFYNVKFHCYFVVELKTVDFEPEFAGKLSFYLSAVDGELKSDLDNLMNITWILSSVWRMSIMCRLITV